VAYSIGPRAVSAIRDPAHSSAFSRSAQRFQGKNPD
jgi:hypothetical protein